MGEKKPPEWRQDGDGDRSWNDLFTSQEKVKVKGRTRYYKEVTKHSLEKKTTDIWIWALTSKGVRTKSCFKPLGE